jgi:integrase
LNGRRIRKALGIADTLENRAEAKKLLPEMVSELTSERIPKKRTFNYYIRSFLKIRTSQGIKPATIEKYSAIASRLDAKFGRFPISDLLGSDARDYFANLALRRCAKTTRDYLSVFRGIFQEAIYDGSAHYNLADVVRLPKEQKAEVDPFSAREAALLLQHSDGWLQSLIALLCYTGMRTGEAIALKWENIFWSANFIRVVATRSNGMDGEPKTANSNRTIPIFEPLEPYLRAQRDRAFERGVKSDYVFLTDAGNAWNDTKNIAKLYWRPLLRRLGLKNRRLYDLRHTFATNMLDSGRYPASLISEWLGHSDFSMIFKRYAKLIKGERKTFDRAFDYTLGEYADGQKR